MTLHAILCRTFELGISTMIEQESIDHVTMFCNNLKNYQNKFSKTKSIRNIGKLELAIPSCWNSDETSAVKYELVKKLMLSCGCVAQSICLGDDTKTTIDDVKQLTSIFHKNLTCFGLGADASLVIKNKNNTATSKDKFKNKDKDKDDKKQREKNIKIGMLKTIVIQAIHTNDNANSNLFDTLKSFDIFNETQCTTLYDSMASSLWCNI